MFAQSIERSECGSDETKLPLPSGSEENAGTNRTNKIANTEPWTFSKSVFRFHMLYEVSTIDTLGTWVRFMSIFSLNL